MKKDEFGDRMKDYESRETDRRFLPYIPVYARIDGRGFSKFTKGCQKPFDPIIADAMLAATSALVRETHALIGYTQSDEISLVWTTFEPGEDMMFKGKVQKMCSVLAGIATAAFMRSLMGTEYVAKTDKLPHFDCRVIQMPNREEAANMLLWREQDARKNSISMAAQANFPHKVLQGEKSAQMIARLADKGIDFDADYPNAFKRGVFIRRSTSSRTIPEDVRKMIPAKSRPEAGSMITRSTISVVDMPQFNHVINRAEVIFDGAHPVTEIFDDLK